MKKRFDWILHPKAERFLLSQVKLFLKHSPQARKLSKKMNDCSTKFFDWIDHIMLPHRYEAKLTKLGFKTIKRDTHSDVKVFENGKSIFFPILTHQKKLIEIAIKPEFLNNFNTKNIHIEGGKDAPYRYMIISQSGNYILSAVERRGYNGYIVHNSSDIRTYKKAVNAFHKRKRVFKTDREGLRYTKTLIKSFKLSPGRIADAFFRAEREYWQSRNSAGQIQHQRQNIFGWGNHDHHTYRSSRENFKDLVSIFEALGMICRERFHSGAGWGAQIMEQPDCKIVVFADVDLSKSEHLNDFAHKGLSQRNNLGTVGLWVGLHGESILQAGMHHLEARFNFDMLTRDLQSNNVHLMMPFSNFQFLKQAFTKGELWTVNKGRAKKLLTQGSITESQYKNFLQNGAIGSHMENLQRSQGYKGFNQHSVTAIINATDPRKQHHRGA